MAVLRVYGYLVEGLPEVHLGEDGGPSNLVGIVPDMRQREEIKHSSLVKSAIIPDYAERTIWLQYKISLGIQQRCTILVMIEIVINSYRNK